MLAQDLMRFGTIYFIFLMGFGQAYYLIFMSYETPGKTSTYVKKNKKTFSSKDDNPMDSPVESILQVG